MLYEEIGAQEITLLLLDRMFGRCKLPTEDILSIAVPAAWHGFAHVVEDLLNKGLDCNAQNEENNTSLIEAARLDQEEVIKVLLGHSAYPGLRSNQNLSPLAEAVEIGACKAAELLLKKGLQLNTIEEAERLLTAAVTECVGQVVERILEEWMIGLDLKNNFLFWSVLSGEEEGIVRILLKSNADPNYYTTIEVEGWAKGRRPLDIAIEIHNRAKAQGSLAGWGQSKPCK
ncbi:hypothetical protein SI65_03595 [Aspergillus cristatus]|uniref:Uncharacterized protein n=1 Tax=Aspergillus cristatus TaxID=573508 RepID=A0A1E3BHU4_ASPCR|nr:hypothetical protein SI65_03595 [Aspergillus cristatus]